MQHTDYSSSVVNETVKTTSAAHCSYLNLVKTKVSEVHLGAGIILHMCDRIWENSPLRAQYDFSVEAFIVYLT